MGERFLGFLNAVPFEVQYRKDDVWNDTEYRIIARGRDFHASAPKGLWRECPEGCFFTASTIPSAELFLATDALLSGNEHAAWRKVYDILSGLPRILFRENDKVGYISVKCGYHDVFFREMMKTHFNGKWNPDDRCWTIYPPDKEYRQAFLSSLSIFASARRRLAIGRPETMEGLPMELLDHQTYVHDLIRSAGNDGKRAFLVAHDMGLGKTYTSLSAVKSFIETSADGRGCVAVVPPGTIRQWRACAAETGLTSSVYHSTNPKWESLGDEELSESDVIITGVEFLKENPERLNVITRHSERRICILDEATKCKNRKCGNYKTILPVSLASDFTVFLSGTPLLNNIEEMENLILLGDPRYYPYKEFAENHIREEKKEVYVPTQKKRITIKVNTYVNEEAFRKKVLPFFDRETKKSTSLGIILPDVEETNVTVVPGEVERKICALLRSEYENFYISSIDEDKTLLQLASGHHSKSGAVIIFEQMVLNAPETIFQSRGKSPVLEAVQERVSAEGLIPAGYVPEKMRKLISILSEPHALAAPSVVFTGFKTTAAVLKRTLEETFPGRPVFLVAGGTAHSKKSKVLSKLRGTDNGIIICTDAMTYGVEMQFASTLVQYDLPWSPMVADQRTDRINRIGASGTRHIYYITAAGTIEESKWRIHEKKRKTVETVLRDEQRTIQQEFAFDI